MNDTVTPSDAAPAAKDAAPDYRKTVFLPRPRSPCAATCRSASPACWRAGRRWALGALREESKGKPHFVLHDGPPYANGDIHIGHALNKILKDVVNRARQMRGYDAHYVPGWDCHGLPIEWKIEEGYRKDGRNKDEVPVLQFRAECRAYAAQWIGVQSEEFQRLGVLGDWAHRYATMDFTSEAAIVGGDRQVPAERRALSRASAGDVVRRSRRPRWPRPRSNTTTTPAPRSGCGFR